MKRAVDFTFALVLCLLLAPLMLVIALAVACTSPGGAIFRQKRIGLGCREFTIYKFRSMVAGADKKGPYFTASGDPRITHVGKFLRKTSLDELPQLWNVVLGNMSLVGPRPDTPAQQAHGNPQDWTERHSVRPGITGLAQATLRSTASPERRMELDLQYVRTHTLGLDFKILAWTLGQVVRRGSY